MSAPRSGPLVAWTRAWIAGHVSLDQVVDAVSAGDAPHRVAERPGVAAFPGAADPVVLAPGLVTLRELLVAWRRAARPVRLLLPVPGDVRGVPGPAAFRSAALDAGEAAAVAGLGAVPQVRTFAPSSAPATVTWHVHPVADLPPDPLTVREAHHELSTVIRESASALGAAQVAGSPGRRGEIAKLLSGARRAGERLDLPPGHPPPAVALLAQAERLAAVLDIVAGDPHGGAVDRAGIQARTAALRPLATAVRRARLAAYNAADDSD